MSDYDRFDRLLFKPLFTPGLGLAVLVDLTIGSVVYPAVPAIDDTAGNAIENPVVADMQSIVPQVAFRATDILALGIEFDDLDDGEVAMNGRTWKIESAVKETSPSGEDAGEYRCNVSEVTT